MIESKLAISLAVGEVESPHWEVTKQYLAVHRVARDSSGEPRVAVIDGVSKVYLELIDLEGDKAAYHLVVAIHGDESGEPEVCGVWIEPLVRVYLTVSSESMDADELSAKIGVPPTRS